MTTSKDHLAKMAALVEEEVKAALERVERRRRARDDLDRDFGPGLSESERADHPETA